MTWFFLKVCAPKKNKGPHLGSRYRLVFVEGLLRVTEGPQRVSVSPL